MLCFKKNDSLLILLRSDSNRSCGYEARKLGTLEFYAENKAQGPRLMSNAIY